ncbi:hypothetical protein BCR33DRAFT_717811 [Rhizoclosmatium globosum]|uniref:Uncharacterized protein n=1 Tax=Rhizoclosmatium globosum TaxID=329046 RepID=A0A1Y2C7S7_9FUNG|nr:hypothetical protein BCR33DRAFT_717811 [Rhizoclosmatium globosum]|eukprot:ORY43080.1 hypothetical protein BCR33DRAFT_717811 [Rhizoclosmatium globosum]
MGAFTIEDVAKHNTESDCWVSVLICSYIHSMLAHSQVSVKYLLYQKWHFLELLAIKYRNLYFQYRSSLMERPTT